jgi:hypothetical protein
MTYLGMEWKDAKQEHFYLAQLTAEVRRSWVDKPKNVKLRDFVLKFGGNEPQGELTDEQLQARIERSKMAWGGLLAAGPKPPPRSRDARRPDTKNHGGAD